MAEWKKVIVSGSTAQLATLQVGSNQQITNLQATTFLTGSFTGSFKGDGSLLTGVLATSLDIDAFGSDLTGITVATTDKLPLSDAGTEGRINVGQLATPLAGTGLEANSNTIRIAAAAAGNGLTGGAGSALAVGAGTHITVNTDDIAVNTTTLIPAISGSIFTTVSGDVTITAGGVATITTNSVALGTDTTGDYVASITSGNGLTGGATGEGSTPTLAVGAGTHITVNADDVAVNTTTLTPAISGSILTNISGDITITAAGVSSIGTGVIVNADVNAAAAIAYTKLNLASSGIVSGSTLAAGSGQGSTTLTTNGVSSGDITATGLGTAGTPTFAGLTITNGNIAINNGTSTALTTTGTTAAVFNTTATTVNAFGAATTLNLGAATGTTTVGNSLVVAGDLFVNGTTTQVNTTDLLVEDKFIILASGSATAGDGGIIIDRGSDGAGNIAFGFDATTDRWGYQNGLSDSTNAIVIGTNGNSAFAGYVFTEADHTATKPITGEFVQAGAIYTNTDGTIWMYA